MPIIIAGVAMFIGNLIWIAVSHSRGTRSAKVVSWQLIVWVAAVVVIAIGSIISSLA